MKTLDIAIAIGIGDILSIRVFFDSIAPQFDQIKVCLNPQIIQTYRNDPKYVQFITEWAKLILSDLPYVFDNGPYTPFGVERFHNMMNQYKMIPKKPNLDHVLCKGIPLEISEPYIVITTKIRGIDKRSFYKKSIDLWRVLKRLSAKYIIVVMGEREVEKQFEYIHLSKIIYGIYDQIISNIPSNRVIDLTVPALGITIPNIDHIKQDCLIMKNAKFVIAMGIGGNFNLSICVANTVGYRESADPHTNALVEAYNNSQFSNLFLTQNWKEFISKLETYI
jgi:hypothetical protein